MATKKAKRTSKKATTKVDINKNVNKIMGTATTLNTQILDTAVEVATEIKDKGVYVKDQAIAQTKEAIDQVAEVITMDNIKTTATTINKYTLKTANEVVDGALEQGENWQKVAAKAVKGSLKLAAKQQVIVFDTLDVVKSQLGQSATRLRKLWRA